MPMRPQDRLICQYLELLLLSLYQTTEAAHRQCVASKCYSPLRRTRLCPIEYAAVTVACMEGPCLPMPSHCSMHIYAGIVRRACPAFRRCRVGMPPIRINSYSQTGQRCYHHVKSVSALHACHTVCNASNRMHGDRRAWPVHLDRLPWGER